MLALKRTANPRRGWDQEKMEGLFSPGLHLLGERVIQHCDGEALRALMWTSKSAREMAIRHVFSEDGKKKEKNRSFDKQIEPGVAVLKASNTELPDEMEWGLVVEHPLSHDFRENPTNIKGVISRVSGRGSTVREIKVLEVRGRQVDSAKVHKAIGGGHFTFVLEDQEDRKETLICLVLLDEERKYLEEENLGTVPRKSSHLVVALTLESGEMIVAFPGGKELQANREVFPVTVVRFSKGRIPTKTTVLKRRKILDLQLFEAGDKIFLGVLHRDSVSLNVIRKTDLQIVKKKRIYPTGADAIGAEVCFLHLEEEQIIVGIQYLTRLDVYCLKFSADDLAFEEDVVEIVGRRFVTKLTEPDEGTILAEQISLVDYDGEDSPLRTSNLQIIKFPRDLHFFWQLQRYSKHLELLSPKNVNV